jgi:hypothetical protein
MFCRVAQRLTRRIAIALIICITLLPTPHSWWLATNAAQGRAEAPEEKAKPKPGKPEVMLPDLDQIRKEKQPERAAPPPIPSTIRSKRNTGKPWDGRRVGDPWPAGALAQAGDRTARKPEISISPRRIQQRQRAHAWRRVNPPPPVLDDQFVQNFFSRALVRNAASDENTFEHSSSFVKTQDPTHIRVFNYSDLDEGVRYTVENQSEEERVVSIDYLPTSKDRRLSCSIQSQGDSTPIFEQYGLISAESENAILDNFAIQLLNDPNLTGKVFLRRGQYSQKFGAKKLLRIKNYLLQKRRVPANRVSAFELHSGPDYTVELYLFSKSKR